MKFNMEPFRGRWDDIKWGVTHGLRFALFVAFFGVLLRLLGGNAAYVDMEISFQSTMIATMSAGMTGGMVAGIFRQMTNTINGSAILGLAIGALSGCTFYLFGVRNLSSIQVVVFIGVYAIVGLLIGVRTRQKVTLRTAKAS